MGAQDVQQDTDTQHVNTNNTDMHTNTHIMRTDEGAAGARDGPSEEEERRPAAGTMNPQRRHVTYKTDGEEGGEGRPDEEGRSNGGCGDGGGASGSRHRGCAPHGDGHSGEGTGASMVSEPNVGEKEETVELLGGGGVAVGQGLRAAVMESGVEGV